MPSTTDAADPNDIAGRLGQDAEPFELTLVVELRLNIAQDDDRVADKAVVIEDWRGGDLGQPGPKVAMNRPNNLGRGVPVEQRIDHVFDLGSIIHVNIGVEPCACWLVLGAQEFAHQCVTAGVVLAIDHHDAHGGGVDNGSQTTRVAGGLKCICGGPRLGSQCFSAGIGDEPGEHASANSGDHSNHGAGPPEPVPTDQKKRGIERNDCWERTGEAEQQRVPDSQNGEPWHEVDPMRGERLAGRKQQGATEEGSGHRHPNIGGEKHTGRSHNNRSDGHQLQP